MRLLHTADIHGRRDLMDDTLQSLRVMRQEAAVREVDLIAISGDTWDSATMASDHARFPEFIDAVSGLADAAPVVMIYGTPSHDVAGSLEVFERINTICGITVLRPGTPYFLSDAGHIEGDEWSAESPVAKGKAIALILGIPEPSKAWLLANQNGMSKAEADEAIEQGLRRLLLGLTAIRKEHADLPCVLLYHGAVRGGKYQNGQPVEEGIGVDDLAMVGADYYALGDIHEPQQVGDMPAYYPGSIVPQNWGETHSPGFNIVDVQAGSHSVDRVNMGVPGNQKIRARAVRDLYGIDIADHEPIERGRRVWLEISCTADQAAQIDIGLFEGRLRLQGAVDGSRVTLRVDAVETVRAGEIAEKQRLRDKLGIWAENTDVTVDDETLELADAIEEEVAKESGSASGASIRLDRVEIRGAIGFWKNQRKDEVSFDLETAGSGVIALIGPNGYGKTTLIENAHPWPQMLTRDGKLQDHFRLRDSWRKLWWTDVTTGIRYRAELLIDGKNKSGGVEHLLYRSADGQVWEPYPGINGRKEPYMDAVTELFGSLPLYLRTAFVTQRPSKSAPELNEATKGERKTLFAELAGIDYFESYRAHAKSKADGLERSILHDEGRLASIEERLAEEPSLRDRLRESGSEVERKKAELDRIGTEGKKLKAGYEAAKAHAEEHSQLRRKREDLQGRIAERKTETEKLEADITLARSALLVRERAEEQIRFYDQLIRDMEAEKKRRSDHIERENARYRAYDGEREKVAAEEKKIRDGLDRHRNSQAQIDRAIDQLKSRIAHIDEVLSAEAHTNCPKCNAALPWAKDEAERRAAMKQERKLKDAELRNALDRLEEIGDEVLKLTAQIESLEYPQKPEPEPFDDSGIREIEKKLFAIDIESERETVDRAKSAEHMISSAENQIRALDEQRTNLHAELLALPEPDLNAEEDAAWALQEYESARERYTDMKASLAQSVARSESAASALADVCKLREEANGIKETIATTKTLSGRYRLLERSFGKDGIPALELDAVAPDVARVANSLLDAAYGARYTIEFRTTRKGGTGARQKQIEDFLIYIHDSEAGDEQEISTLSGGESVWIKRAIYDAFAVIRAQNTGIQFLTAFQDETDGALDPDARVRYFRMLEEAHRQSGRYQTVLITHSSELQAMITNRMDIRDLGTSGNGRVAA